MGDTTQSNALRRKTSARHRTREAEGLSPARAMRLAVARAAGELWELPLTVSGMRHELIAYEDIEGRLSNDTMMVLLDGPEAIRGGLCVDRNLLMSVTEVQTLGKVSGRQLDEREFTPTDAALFSPLLDATMERLDMMLSTEGSEVGQDDGRWILGYRFGAMLEDARSLALAMAGDTFHYLNFEIDIGAGLRQGNLVICVPEEEGPADDPAMQGNRSDDDFSSSLSLVQACLSAHLPRVALPLSDVTQLKVGDTVPLPVSSLNRVGLRGADGLDISRCSLGKIGEMRALKLQPRGANIAHKPQPPRADALGTLTEITPSEQVAVSAQDATDELSPPPA